MSTTYTLEEGALDAAYDVRGIAIYGKAHYWEAPRVYKLGSSQPINRSGHELAEGIRQAKVEMEALATAIRNMEQLLYSGRQS